MNEQLSLFEDKLENGTDLKPINYRDAIGCDKDMAHIKGYEDLTEHAQRLLKYLLRNHSQETDPFIHADELGGIMGYNDTRLIREFCAEIDMKTELVIYSSQRGYKIASNEHEIDMAVRFQLAPALTTIKRTFAKNKNSTLHWIHGLIGNLEKEFGGHVTGQLEATQDMALREVNHLPDERPMPDYVYTPNEIKALEKESMK